MHSWRRVAVALAVVAMTASWPAAPAAASGSAGVVNNTDTFSKTTWRYASNMQMCIKTTFSGKITYRAEHVSGLSGALTDAWRLTKITFSQPRTSTWVYKYDPGNNACTTKPAKVEDLYTAARLRTYSCKYNPSIQVSAPPAIGYSFWPSCKKRTAAKYADTRHNRSSMSLFVDGSYVKFGNQVVFNQGGKPGFHCYGVRTTIKISKGNPSYKWTTSRQRICLSPKF